MRKSGPHTHPPWSRVFRMLNDGCLARLRPILLGGCSGVSRPRIDGIVRDAPATSSRLQDGCPLQRIASTRASSALTSALNKAKSACAINSLAALLTVRDSLDRVKRIVHVGFGNSTREIEGKAAAMNGALRPARASLPRSTVYWQELAASPRSGAIPDPHREGTHQP